MRELDETTTVGKAHRSQVMVTNGVFLIDTPRTCGVFAEGGEYAAGALRVEMENVPATIWASSLDGASLAESRRILVTHLTDVQNTGASYADADMTVLKDFGRLPHLLRDGRAEIELLLGKEHPSSLKPTPAEWQVWALGTDGRRECEIPFAIDPSTGHLRFTASTRQPFGACMYYEIARR